MAQHARRRTAWSCPGRSARAAAAASRSAWSTSTHWPRDLHQRPGLRGQAGDLGRVELDVVEQHRPAHVGQLVGADHRRAWTSRPRGAAVGVARRVASTGHPDVEAGRGQAAARGSDISSQASSWLRTTSPRRWPPGRSSAGSRRSRRASSVSAWRRLSGGAVTSARSRGTGWRSMPVGRHRRAARRCPRRAGRAAPRAARPPAWVTGLAQRSRRWVSSAATRLEARNRLPSNRDRKASDISAALVGAGGGAGSSSRSAPSRQMASTNAASTPRVKARGSGWPSRAVTTPGSRSTSAAEALGVDEGRGPAETAASTGSLARLALVAAAAVRVR